MDSILDLINAVLNLFTSIGEIQNTWNDPDPRKRRMARLGCGILVALPVIVVAIVVVIVVAMS